MRFVTPDVVRITLKNGTDWIEVKKELNVGEDNRFRMTAFKELTPGDDDAGTKAQIGVDWEKLATARASAYIVGWSDKRPVTLKAIEDMAKDDFKEIDTAILTHIKAEEDAKKVPAGETSPLPPSA